MHVSGFSFDFYPLLQFIFTVCVIIIGILHLVKSTASKYFIVDANFEEGGEEALIENRKKKRNQMIAVDGCAVCGKDGTKQCSRCKSVRYCSGTCQLKHWKEGHNLKCPKNAKLSVSNFGEDAAVCDSKLSKELPQLKKVLFPYEDFVKLFNWENSGFRPSGLLNCGNSCYANVVLQCLSCTRPLVAYLLEIGHRIKCKRNDWCFLCELERHVERARCSWQPFSPINILSRLPNIGGNLGYGKQEDAHEFMRFAIDTMQSVCLDEFGGEKVIHPSSQETTLIQYIFGGHLQSQVKCLKCNKISYRHENMMDLTVEIQGDSESLEECLDQFTAEEWLDGENMYRCDGCNDYVKACKRLAIHHAPNILTIALKRFQSGRFGKLNKRVTFPETLDLGPYMSKPGYDTDFYRLYAVVVHIDMLNASYFGHYVCYTKDFRGNWYRIDDCKVTGVDLEEVLSQGAYMLLYSRMCVRSSCANPLETCKEEEEKQEVVEEAEPYSITIEGSHESSTTIASLCTDVRSTEEEKQQGMDVAEEAESCLQLPVESITTEGSLNSLSTIEDDSVCVNVDEPVEINSRFASLTEEEKQQDVDVVEEAQPCLRLPVESCSYGKQSRPLFSRGFIDKNNKHTRRKSPTKFLVKPSRNGFIGHGVSHDISAVHGMLNSDGQPTQGAGLAHDCTSSSSHVSLVEHNAVHDLSGIFDSHGPPKSEEFSNGIGPCHDSSSLSLHVPEIAHLHGFNVEAVGSCSSSQMSEESSSVPSCSDIEMLDESTQSQQSPSLVQMAPVELGNGTHAACPSNNNSCSKRSKPGFPHAGFLIKKTRESSSKVNAADTRFVEMDVDEGEDKVEVGDECSNGNTLDESFWGNGNFSPGFLDKQPRKKSLKKDKEASCLDGMVSSNHDRNKLPRFG